MAGNHNSGRRPRRLEERGLIAKTFDDNVRLVVKLRDDLEVPPHVRLDAAKYLIDQHIGRPKQRVETTGENGGAITIRVKYDNSE